MMNVAVKTYSGRRIGKMTKMTTLHILMKMMNLRRIGLQSKKRGLILLPWKVRKTTGGQAGGLLSPHGLTLPGTASARLSARKRTGQETWAH